MKAFRTVVQPSEFDPKLQHRAGVFLAGSCFSENMGNKLSYFKFDPSLDPFGIVYNPESLFKNLERLLNGTAYTASELNNLNGTWFSYDHHSRFNSSDREETLRAINTAFAAGKSALENATYIFLTLGTAWRYRLRESGRTVANCHRVPNTQFEKALLSPASIEAHGKAFLQKLEEVNPRAQVVFTVSPVRHWKDTAIGNQRSKAHLLTAVHALCETHACCHYFPAYEMMMDDLRDYRFYASDMLHPNDTAIDYIWEAFSNSFFSEDTKALNKRIDKIKRAVNHRPFNTNTEDRLEFIRNQEKSIFDLKEINPQLDFSAELSKLSGSPS